jgi:GNAT superfamily N-acetyltransferase
MPIFELAKSRLDELRREAEHEQRVRLARDSDRGAVRAFLGRLSTRTVQARYLLTSTALDGSRADLELERLFDPEAERTVVLAVEGPDVRGIGEFAMEDGERAELALLVEDAYQGRGIGKRLFRALERLASRRGVSTFTGDLAYGNSRMLGLLRGRGRMLQTQRAYGSLRFMLRLGP